MNFRHCCRFSTECLVCVNTTCSELKVNQDVFRLISLSSILQKNALMNPQIEQLTYFHFIWHALLELAILQSYCKPP